eukprot:5908918-Alexandrium_andersonii.AAC.1
MGSALKQNESCLNLLGVDLPLRGLGLESADLHADGSLGGGRLSESPVLLEPQPALGEDDALC